VFLVCVSASVRVAFASVSFVNLEPILPIKDVLSMVRVSMSSYATGSTGTWLEQGQGADGTNLTTAIHTHALASPVNLASLNLSSLNFGPQVFVSASGAHDVPDVPSVDKEEPATGRGRALSPGGFVCQAQPPAAFNPTVFCSGIVDYPYIIPDGYSDEMLESAARGLATSMGVGFFKTSCLTDIKRFICANVYMKCADGGEFLLNCSLFPTVG